MTDFTGASDTGQMEPAGETTVVYGPAAAAATAKWGTWDTVAFPAIRGDDDGCRCGMHPPAGEPGKDALLSCGPGVVSKMWRNRVRDGEWADIPGEFGGAQQRVYAEARKGQQRIHNNLDCDWHDIAAVFRADTALLSDPALAARLALFETELAEKAAELRRWVAERAESIRREAETRTAA